MFIQHLETIKATAYAAGRRSGFSQEQVEDFVSTVQLKIIDENYRVLRRHRGESRLSTFLVTVINNMCRDFRDHLWGKFRPSAQAKALGETAIILEKLIVRDGFEAEAAIAIAHDRFGVTESREQMNTLLGGLPSRTVRRFYGEEVLAKEHAAVEESPERRIDNAQRMRDARRVEEVLKEALDALEPDDLLILKLHLRDGLTLADIARHLRLDPQALYPRKRRCIRQLRGHFATRGLRWDDVKDLLGWREHELRSPLTTPALSRPQRRQSATERQLEKKTSHDNA